VYSPVSRRHNSRNRRAFTSGLVAIGKHKSTIHRRPHRRHWQRLRLRLGAMEWLCFVIRRPALGLRHVGNCRLGRISTAVRAPARYGVLHFEQKCLRTEMEFVSMTTVVRWPRTGGACREVTCRERHWCHRMLERGLSRTGLPLKRKFRPRCCAKTRAGAPCIMRVVPGKRRCRFHGGLSTGPRTVEGRARIAEAQWRRWRARRAANAKS